MHESTTAFLCNGGFDSSTRVLSNPPLRTNVFDARFGVFGITTVALTMSIFRPYSVTRLTYPVPFLYLFFKNVGVVLTACIIVVLGKSSKDQKMKKMNFAPVHFSPAKTVTNEGAGHLSFINIRQ